MRWKVVLATPVFRCCTGRCLFFLLFLLPAAGFAQFQTVTGTVTDSAGAPVEGVSVVIKDGKGGTQTNAAGKYSLTVTPHATLIFSALNYETYQQAIGSGTVYNITLQKADSKALNDVVVVGYATQKKVNMTGAVASISSEDLAGRPVTNVSSALAGLAPGVSVRQSSGKPGSDGATIRVRGVGTLNNSDPLVVIDGIIGSMDAVNPDDIASISILKDAASASIYGSLAGNGVILITTKKGSRSKTTVTYNGLLSRTKPMNHVDFVTDYPRHMRLINEGYSNLGQSKQFSDGTIQTWENANANPNGTNSAGVPNWLAYPNTDWYHYMINAKTAQQHNLSVSGGSDKVLYLLSANYLNNPGTIRNSGTERYQLRANVEARINKVITLGTQTFASRQSYGMANIDNLFTYLSQTTPGVYPYYDGKYGYAVAAEESPTANNPRVYTDGTGGSNIQNRFNTTLYATLHLLKGLTLESRMNYQTRFQEQNSYTIPINRWDFSTNTLKLAAATPDKLGTSYSYNRDYTVTLDHVLRYTTQINRDHDISVLAGYNEFYFNYYDFNASKLGLIDYNITTLGSAGNTSNQAGGQQYDRSMRSLFGRVNYAFKNRYLLEGNLRYDGTSHFAPDNRWGYFPSVSAGWRISEEDFFSGFKNNIQNLKLRASWGKLGNNYLPNKSGGTPNDYGYQAVYSSVPYSFNGVAVTGLRQGSIANPLLQWESTTHTNVGVEATLFRSFNVEIDLYNRQTDRIITQPPVPLVVGTAAAPVQNTASVLNRGIEVNLGWSKKIGRAEIALGGNFSYNYNTVNAYKGKYQETVTDVNGVKTYSNNFGAVSNNGSPGVIVEDHKIGEYYVLQVYKGNGSYTNADGSVNTKGGPRDGMIRTPQDLAWLQAMIAAGYKFAPTGTVSPSGTGTGLTYGDLIYADNNGDGIYGSTLDRKFTGTSDQPKYIFGFSANVAWKGFDLSMIWAGAAGMQYYWNDSYNSSVIRNGWHVMEKIADDHYYYNAANPADPANNINGKFPRLKNNADGQNNFVSGGSSFWLYNASYIKLKNLQIGYTIPQRIASKALITRSRIYVSAENLLMITKYPGLDPEIGASVSYPTMRQYAVGLTVSF